MKKYVIGFMFIKDRIVLIRKTHPLWQAGKLNGVGGEIEEGENPLDAMCREFKEELQWDFKDWKWFATIDDEGVMVYAFMARCNNANTASLPARNDKGERIFIVQKRDIHYEESVHDLIPLIEFAFMSGYVEGEYDMDARLSIKYNRKQNRIVEI